MPQLGRLKQVANICFQCFRNFTRHILEVRVPVVGCILQESQTPVQSQNLGLLPVYVTVYVCQVDADATSEAQCFNFRKAQIVKTCVSDREIGAFDRYNQFQLWA